METSSTDPRINGMVMDICQLSRSLGEIAKDMVESRARLVADAENQRERASKAQLHAIQMSAQRNDWRTKAEKAEARLTRVLETLEAELEAASRKCSEVCFNTPGQTTSPEYRAAVHEWASLADAVEKVKGVAQA